MIVTNRRHSTLSYKLIWFGPLALVHTFLLACFSVRAEQNKSNAASVIGWRCSRDL